MRIKFRWGWGVTLFIFCSMLIAFIAGCPMPEPTPEPVVEPTPPGTMDAPTLEVGNEELIVTWTAPNNGGSAITGYELQYSSDGGTTWTEISSGITGTDHTITDLTNGTLYEVQVRAIGAQGTGGWSDSALATPVAVPHAPDLPSLTVENEQLRISWAAPTDTGGSAITGYDLRYAINNSPLPNEPQISNTINTSHTIMQLEIGSRYTVQLRAINAEGRGPWSESAAKTFPLVAAQVPEGTEVFVILSTAVDNAIANAANPNIT
ncbi:MAG: fibronectin type III domain-containing protein, partial [Salinispira sp.]